MQEIQILYVKKPPIQSHKDYVDVKTMRLETSNHKSII